MNLDPWKLLWIWIRQNYVDPLNADPMDPDLQHCFADESYLANLVLFE